MRGRTLPCGKTFETRPIYQKNIQPTVIVIVVEGNAAAGGLEQILVFVLAAKNCFGVQPRFGSHVDKREAQAGRYRSVRTPIGIRVRLRIRLRAVALRIWRRLLATQRGTLDPVVWSVGHAATRRG